MTDTTIPPIPEPIPTGGHPEIRTHFEEQMDEIQVRLVDMATMVLANTRRAGDVILENRFDEVEAVMAADTPINEEYLVLEERIFQILALQQPVASDLRFLVSATRLLYEIERSGDLAVNIVKQMKRVDGIPTDPVIHSLVARLVDAAATMFARGIEALATMDPEIGMSAEHEDQATDELTAELFTAVTSRQDDIGLEASVALFYIGRFLERIADHGVNMAQNVTFTVTAQFPSAD
jgi:phosphate transport system protein